MPVVSELSPISLSVFFYVDGTPVRPARLFFMRPDTEDPITVYTDAGLGVPHERPVLTGGSGRCPPVYVGTEPYRVRVFDSWGALVEEIPWLPGAQGATGGGGGSGLLPAEQEALIKTGDYLLSFANNVARAGYVRCNGGLIGPDTFNDAGYDMERLNNDTKALFIHLWGQEQLGVLTIIGGRGASAEDDWNASKAIALPDLRGRTLTGTDGMGGEVTNRLNLVPILPPGGYTRVGTYGGVATAVLTIAQLPAHSHSCSSVKTNLVIASADANITIDGAQANLNAYDFASVNTGNAAPTTASNTTGISIPNHSHGLAISSGSAGTGAVAQFAQAGGYWTGGVQPSSLTVTDPGHTHTVALHSHTVDLGSHTHTQTNHVHTITQTRHDHLAVEPAHSHVIGSTGSGAVLSTTGLFSLCCIYIKL